MVGGVARLTVVAGRLSLPDAAPPPAPSASSGRRSGTGRHAARAGHRRAARLASGPGDESRRFRSGRGSCRSASTAPSRRPWRRRRRRISAPALTQVVKRVLVWWMAVPGDLRRGDTLEVRVRAAGRRGAAGLRGAHPEQQARPDVRGLPLPAGGGALRALLRRQAARTSSSGSSPPRSTAGSRSPRSSRTDGATRAWTSRRRWARR